MPNDTGGLDNPLNLPDDILKQRKIVKLDIFNEPLPEGSTDPKTFETQLENQKDRLAFDKSPGWEDKSQPRMTIYKLVKAKMSYAMISGKAERFIVLLISFIFSA